MINFIASGAQPLYHLAGALIGYQLGVGEAFNYQPVSSSGSASTDRVSVMAGIEKGFEIWVVAAGTLLPNVTPGSSSGMGTRRRKRQRGVCRRRNREQHHVPAVAAGGTGVGMQSYRVASAIGISELLGEAHLLLACFVTVESSLHG